MATIVGTNGNNLNLNGTGAIDHIFGLAGNDTLRGFGSHDQLFGGSGNDKLFGGTGNDRLKGGLGNDLLDGGTGNDTADYSNATIDPPGPVGPILTTGAISGVKVTLTSGNGQATGGAGTDQLVNIENVTGSKFNDTMDIQDSEGGTFNGGAGKDDLSASFSFCTLNGGDNNDTLSFGSGFGTLNGGAGNDQIWIADGTFIVNGGTGNDVIETAPIAFITFATVTGGAGADLIKLDIDDEVICDYNAISDSPTGTGRDVITGFDGGSGDRIDLTNIPVTNLSYVGGILNINTDFDPAVEMQIQLIGSPDVLPYILV
jgi:Ca2+-binding RTX toxin-like protein